MEIKIIQMGVGFEIRIIINKIRFFTNRNFDTEEEARKFLKEHAHVESH